MEDLKELYNSNKDFETYVNKFSNTRGISPAEAMTYVVVIEYAKQLLLK